MFTIMEYNILMIPDLVQDKKMGVYLAEPVAYIIAVTFTVILFAVQFKKSLKIVEMETIQ